MELRAATSLARFWRDQGLPEIPFPNLDWIGPEAVQEELDRRAGFVVSDINGHETLTRDDYNND